MEESEPISKPHEIALDVYKKHREVFQTVGDYDNKTAKRLAKETAKLECDGIIAEIKLWSGVEGIEYPLWVTVKEIIDSM